MSARQYEFNWRHWVSWCEGSGWDPWDAPFVAVAGLFGACVKGTPWNGKPNSPAPGTLDGLWRAVTWRLEQAGLVPVFRQAEHVVEFGRLRDGYARWWSESAPAAVERIRSKPMLADDVRLVLAFEPDVDVDGGTFAAGIACAEIVMLLSGCGVRDVEGLLGGDVTRCSDVRGVDVEFGAGGVLRVVCEHPELAGWAGGCPACTLARTSDAVGPDGRLLPVAGRLRGRVRSLNTGWGAVLVGDAPERLAFREDVSASARRGLLAVLSYSASGDGVRPLWAKARLASMWCIGESAYREAAKFTVGHVTGDRDGGSLVVVNPNTGHTSTLTPTINADGDALYSVYACLSEWMSVVAAAGLGGDAALFPACGNGGMFLRTGPLNLGKTLKWLTVFLNDAGLTGFTPGSTQTGYVAEAARRNVDILAVAAATNTENIDALHATMVRHAAARGATIRRLVTAHQQATQGGR